jgi:formate dehydrogenase maturation protein FdhE
MATAQITRQEAAITQLFQQPASHKGKLVKVSEEQIEKLKKASEEERKQMIRTIYQEGNDERTINP